MEENKKIKDENKAPTGVPENGARTLKKARTSDEVPSKIEGKEKLETKPAEVSKKPSKKELVRILAADISGNKSVYAGLTKVKGVSWNFSNALCNKLKIDKEKKINELSEEELKKISEFIKNPELPTFLVNRRKDFETGEDKHLSGSDLELRTEFDIKRLRKIKSYRGLRHATGQPTRGQRTKSHFRKNKTVGVAGKKKR